MTNIAIYFWITQMELSLVAHQASRQISRYLAFSRLIPSQKATTPIKIIANIIPSKLNFEILLISKS